MACDGECSWRRRFDALSADYDNVEIDLRAKRRQIAQLQAALDAQEAERVDAPIVVALFDYWRLQCRNGRKSVKLGDKRRQAIKGRLRDGYSTVQLMHAIDGAMVGAFVNEAGKKFDDIELIMRNEVQVDRFIDRWGDHEEHRINYMTAHGVDPYWQDDVDTSDANVARIEELMRVREYLRSRSGTQ